MEGNGSDPKPVFEKYVPTVFDEKVGTFLDEDHPVSVALARAWNSISEGERRMFFKAYVLGIEPDALDRPILEAVMQRLARAINIAHNSGLN